MTVASDPMAREEQAPGHGAQARLRSLAAAIKGDERTGDSCSGLEASASWQIGRGGPQGAAANRTRRSDTARALQPGSDLRRCSTAAAHRASGSQRPTAEQLRRLADGAPVAVVGTHLQTDGGLAGDRLKAFQPADGITDGLLDRVIEPVEVRMGLQEVVNEPVGPGGRVG